VVVEKMRAGSGNYGFDAARGTYGDLMEAGIIDPTKVVRVALENAVSVASVLLLTEAIMTQVPEPKSNGPRPGYLAGEWAEPAGHDGTPQAESIRLGCGPHHVRRFGHLLHHLSDFVLQLVLSRGRPRQVGLGDDPQHGAPAVHHRDTSYLPLRHEVHAIVDAGVRPQRGDSFGHRLTDQRVGRVHSLRGDPAGEIPVRHHADQPVRRRVDHRQGSEVSFCHHARSPGDTILRRAALRPGRHDLANSLRCHVLLQGRAAARAS
jgi:hypothetical protein